MLWQILYTIFKNPFQVKVVAVDAELNVFYEDSAHFDRDLLEFGYVPSGCVGEGWFWGPPSTFYIHEPHCSGVRL